MSSELESQQQRLQLSFGLDVRSSGHFKVLYRVSILDMIFRTGFVKSPQKKQQNFGFVQSQRAVCLCVFDPYASPLPATLMSNLRQPLPPTARKRTGFGATPTYKPLEP